LDRAAAELKVLEGKLRQLTEGQAGAPAPARPPDKPEKPEKPQSR
jgi:hypothetical protein